MRGEVLSYDAAAGAGLISGDDGARYSFNSLALRGGPVRPGQKVDFVPVGGEATEIMGLGGASLGLPAQVGGFDWQRALFSFEGRLRRSHFWIAWLIILAANVLTSWIPFVGLLLLWPTFAIDVKRLHDMGLTGWLVILPWVLNIVGTIAMVASIGLQAIMNAPALEAEDPAAIIAMVAPIFGWLGLLLLANLGFLLWIGLVEGTRGPNRYGEDPKGRI
ncbi:DUF805 domain-containing protein [Brevundimonas sp.]|uniref:DUF805 domain-containing protein n=1 Tax=Brevundimonas sp. TaxID=1871086 RepID=UPI0022C87A3F|nr:DUF805 domain-containing protein [Brevundimonas sp.]MCZ8194502.1 DUF805 domain-containing protein [Brevundimonas sp.]